MSITGQLTRTIVLGVSMKYTIVVQKKKIFFLGYIGLTEVKDYRKFQLRMALILEKIAKIDCVTGQLTDLVILGLKNNCINFFFPLSFWWNKLVILT